MTQRPLPDFSLDEANDVAIGVMEILRRSYCDEIETGTEDVRLEKEEAVYLFEQAIVGIEQFDRLTALGTHCFKILRKQVSWWRRFRLGFKWPAPPDHSKTVRGFRQCLQQIHNYHSTSPTIVVPPDVYWCAKGWVDSYNKEQSFHTSPYR